MAQRKKSPGTKDAALARLRRAGLRPTRQRAELARLLFSHGERHVSAEMLHAEAARSGVHVSLATVYNTLHQFTEHGLLKQVVVNTSRSYFDTNTGPHQHFFIEDEARLIDIPDETVAVSGIPAVPKGTTLAAVDVVVRVRRNPG